MKRSNASDRLYLRELAHLAQRLKAKLGTVSVGELLALRRKELMMPQRVLSERSKVPQSSISRIESERLHPNLATLDRLAEALECDLVIGIVPRREPKEILREQALAKAKAVVGYVRGTMSLEEQEPDREFLQELLEEEADKVLQTGGSQIWNEGM